MKPSIEKFLKFCDKNTLTFEIHYRANFRDPEARFYLTFSSFHDVEIMTPDDINLTKFNFANGSTPTEAIENCIDILQGCWVQFYVLNNMNKVLVKRVYQ